ncbi:MAG: hypothetical protein E5Y74_07995 [Mesorhizobium sp.]|nr:MAG: hypothetical protein E5Y74_07995 [Mesorhizobium sp.]
MALRKKTREPLAFKNPNKAWVIAELLKIYAEWKAWGEFVKQIVDHPYDRNTQMECFADGEENLDKNEVLVAKTLTFLDNNISGHNFMFSNEYEEPWENRTARLGARVPHHLHQLDILQASLQYAVVPDGFWKEQGKKLVEDVRKAAPDKAADVAASWLRNPLSIAGK